MFDRQMGPQHPGMPGCWLPMAPMGAPWAPWGPLGPHGAPWGPMGPHGAPWGPWGPMGPKFARSCAAQFRKVDKNWHFSNLGSKMGQKKVEIEEVGPP